MIYTWSQFNYGQTVSLDTQAVPFKEGANPALVAELPVGSYSLADFAQAIEDALNSTGTLVYTCTVNRSENTLTISGSSTFALLTSQSATAFQTMGFTQSVDLVGAASYTGNSPSGSRYFPQFKLQSYVPGSNNAKSISATINESASGRIEVVRFGINHLIEMEIKFITNLPMDGLVIKNNKRGLSDALAFMNYVTTKGPFEFVPDVKHPDEYIEVLLESTDAAADGTGFKLKELFADNIPDIYESGLLTLRIIQ